MQAISKSGSLETGSKPAVNEEKVNSVSYAGRTWFLTKRVAALLVINYIFCIAVVLLHYNNIVNFKISNKLLLKISWACQKFLTDPTMHVANFLTKNSPALSYRDHKILHLFIRTATEDIRSIGLIQRTVLPLFSKLLPKHLGNIVNHRVTRVTLSSALFALSHGHKVIESPFGVIPQFFGGLLYGAVAEADNSLLAPVLAHFIFDLSFGNGKRV